MCMPLAAGALGYYAGKERGKDGEVNVNVNTEPEVTGKKDPTNTGNEKKPDNTGTGGGKEVDEYYKDLQ